VPQKKTRKIGLARALSKLGYCSRAQAAAMIRGGHVSLNGSVRRDWETPVRLEHDRIAVDGCAVESRRHIYLMMNKPRGLITTASDEKGRETVYSKLSKMGETLPWVAPVGRLDKASEGLLLLTNDSEWGARIAAPETHLEKVYHVQVRSVIGEQIAEALIQGIKVQGTKTEDAEILRSLRARPLRSGEKNCWLEITLDEGKNRQIRRMLQALGIEVLRLVRVAIGPLFLGQLQKGQQRSLTRDEKRALDLQVARNLSTAKTSAAKRSAAKRTRPRAC
jgi:23S rRNA pseudouridine2605 synthase